MSEGLRYTVRDFINVQILRGDDAAARKADAVIQLLAKFSDPPLAIEAVLALTMDEIAAMMPVIVARIEQVITTQGHAIIEKLSKLH